MAKPVCVSDFEELARKNLPQYAYDFYASGANEEFTLKENCQAYKRLLIRPQILRGISEVDMSLSLFGERISIPICMAPAGLQAMANSMAEMASAQAAQDAETCMVLSCMSSSTIEDVARAAPNGLRWFQMYIFRDQELTRSLIKRAEDSGYKAIVLTADAIIHGRRWRDLRNQSMLVPHAKFGNVGGPKTEASPNDYAQYIKSLIEQAIDWKSFLWLKSVTKLPVLIKGILTAEDARLAVKHGVDGIIVSNHGGRQLDGEPATIDALPEVVKAVEGKVDVFVDGGVRNGTDVLKALALGARAVFIGRPVIWGLAYQGKQGVSDVLEILKEELKVAMVSAGCARLSDIKPSLVVKDVFYHSRL
ncbi:hypothetical protein ACROYT_G042213 [Oculina patagonica]